MDAADLQALREIAALPEETDQGLTYRPNSNARMRAVAQSLIKHAEEFDLDGPDTGGDQAAGLPAQSYLASLAADILTFARALDPSTPLGIGADNATFAVEILDGPGAVLHQAVGFLGDTDTGTYESLKGFQIR